MKLYSNLLQQRGKYFLATVPLYVCENGERARVHNVEVDLISLNIVDATTKDVISSQYPEWEGYKVSVAFDYGEVKGTNGFTPKGNFPLIRPWKIPIPQALLTIGQLEAAEKFHGDFILSASPALKDSALVNKGITVGIFLYCYMNSGFLPLNEMLMEFAWTIMGYYFDDILNFPEGPAAPTLRECFDYLGCLNRALHGDEEIWDEAKWETFIPNSAPLLKMCRQFREICLAYSSPEEVGRVMREFINFLEVTVYEKYGWTGTDRMDGMPPNVPSYRAMREDGIGYHVSEETSLIERKLTVPEELRRDPLYRYLQRRLTDLFVMQHDAHSLKKEIEKGEFYNNFIMKVEKEHKTYDEAWNEGMGLEIPGWLKEIEEASKKLMQRWDGVVNDLKAILDSKFDIPDANVRFGLISRRCGNGTAATSVTFAKP